MNICITGALGHIGSALIRRLSLPDVDRIYLLDNFLTQRYASLFDLPDGLRYRFCEMDILSGDAAAVIRDSDVLIHLAAVTNAEASFHNARLVEDVNNKGLENVAKICAQHGCALIFPSSTSVYGVQEGEVDESCPPSDLKPQSPYAESKLYGERLLQSLGEKKGLRYVVFRLGTIFGYSAGMRFHTAVNKFIWQASLGENVTVWKTALHQKRPYCDLADCIEAIQYAIKDNVFDGEIYNILTTNLTVNDIIETIKRYVPGLKVQFVDSPIMNQLSYQVSTKKSLARGFRYNGDLDSSISEVIQKLRNMNTFEQKKNL
jgi:nucleoside-diphosphate-sugar epimerase